MGKAAARGHILPSLTGGEIVLVLARYPTFLSLRSLQMGIVLSREKDLFLGSTKVNFFVFPVSVLWEAK